MSLANPQHNKVVEFYMRGLSKSEAMLKAGYSQSMAETRSGDVFNREDVKAEILKRQQRAAKKVGVSKEWVLERLASIASADVGALLAFDENGNPSIDWAKMDQDMVAGIGGLETSTVMRGREGAKRPVTTVKVKMADKLTALQLLGKELGMFKDKVEVTGDEELIAALNAGRNRAARRNADDASSGEEAGPDAETEV